MERSQLEITVIELMQLYEIEQPPIPIEAMLQNPREQMWNEVDVRLLSRSSSPQSGERFAPRMTVARLLAKHVIASAWGQERNLDALLHDEQLFESFTRMLLMPSPMVMALTPSSRTPYTFSTHFEVPEADVVLRMRELGYPV